MLRPLPRRSGLLARAAASASFTAGPRYRLSELGPVSRVAASGCGCRGAERGDRRLLSSSGRGRGGGAELAQDVAGAAGGAWGGGRGGKTARVAGAGGGPPHAGGGGVCELPREAERK